MRNIDSEDRENLTLIEAGNALVAEIEYDLEARGLITTDDGPYAKLTEEGRRAL